jgi:hypothetical protein
MSSSRSSRTSKSKYSGLQDNKDFGFPNIDDVLENIEKDVLDDKYTSSTNVIPNHHCDYVDLTDEEQLLVQQWVKLHDISTKLAQNAQAIRKTMKTVQDKLMVVMADKQINSIGVGDVCVKHKIVQRSNPITLNYLSQQLRSQFKNPETVDKLLASIDKNRGVSTIQKITKE